MPVERPIECQRIQHLDPSRGTFDCRVGILIPAFNEADHLPFVIEECLALGPAVIVVVDDASTDDTPEVMRQILAGDLRGVALVSARQQQNQGKQAAVRRGLRLLRRYPLDAVALIDGDGQHDPRELPPLARLLERHHGVIGARSRRQMPAHRRLSNWLVNAGFRWIGGVDFVDVQSGLRLYRKPLADLLARELPREGGYGVEHESLAILARHARRQGITLLLAAAPASCAYGQAESAMGPGHILQLAVETVRQAARIRRAVQQPQVAGAGGVL